MKIPAFFSEAMPDPVGEILGTGYWRFVTPFGIDGLAKWTHDRIDVLAVGAYRPGRGAFRTFIEQVKKHFDSVYLWHIMNPLMHGILTGYGFTEAEQVEGGEKMKGYKWERKQA